MHPEFEVFSKIFDVLRRLDISYTHSPNCYAAKVDGIPRALTRNHVTTILKEEIEELAGLSDTQVARLLNRYHTYILGVIKRLPEDKVKFFDTYDGFQKCFDSLNMR